MSLQSRNCILIWKYLQIFDLYCQYMFILNTKGMYFHPETNLQKVQIDFAFSTRFNELDIINCVVCWWTFIKNNWLTVNSRKLYLPTKLYQSNFQGLE